MSERLAAQFSQLEEDRQQLRTVLSSMEEGVIAVDPEQRILFANNRAAQLLDFPAARVVGRPLGELLERQADMQDVVRNALKEETDHSRELIWNGPGSRRPGSARGPAAGQSAARRGAGLSRQYRAQPSGKPASGICRQRLPRTQDAAVDDQGVR